MSYFFSAFKKKYYLCFNELKRPFLPNNFDTSTILINSIPKSGTHLLSQIVECIPGLENRQLFIASRPTLSYKNRSSKKIIRLLSKAKKNELIIGHIEHNKSIQNWIKKNNIVQILLIRDPRDVVISESYYLTYMNKFHRLHKFFKKLTTDEERINLAINGFRQNINQTIEFPSIDNRYDFYIKWAENNTYVVRYEDLIGKSKKQTIVNLLKYIKLKGNYKFEIKSQIINSLESISPTSSHTFRQGKKNEWMNILFDYQKKWFQKKMKIFLKNYGYKK